MTLGRGQLGYLTLILPAASYNTIPGSPPFVRPTDPGMFTPTSNAVIITRAGAGGVVLLTAADIATQKITHDETERFYKKTQAVESTL